MNGLAKDRDGIAALNRGVVYSVSYYTRPTFTVMHLPHHLRLAQAQGEVGGQNVTARYPQLAICRRDFIPYDHSDKVGKPDTPEPAKEVLALVINLAIYPAILAG